MHVSSSDLRYTCHATNTRSTAPRWSVLRVARSRQQQTKLKKERKNRLVLLRLYCLPAQHRHLCGSTTGAPCLIPRNGYLVFLCVDPYSQIEYDVFTQLLSLCAHSLHLRRKGWFRATLGKADVDGENSRETGGGILKGGGVFFVKHSTAYVTPTSALQRAPWGGTKPHRR